MQLRICIANCSVEMTHTCNGTCTCVQVHTQQDIECVLILDADQGYKWYIFL